MLYQNFLGGMAWSLGATTGLAIIIAILTFILGRLGGLPLVGEWLANIVAETSRALETHRIPLQQ
ncbi:MAG: DUF5665 domain-containing protein [bacterium]|nr:DUF5665 domain-containing protein [bacterium]